jgi:hypothetical protein
MNACRNNHAVAELDGRGVLSFEVQVRIEKSVFSKADRARTMDPYAA